MATFTWTPFNQEFSRYTDWRYYNDGPDDQGDDAFDDNQYSFVFDEELGFFEADRYAWEFTFTFEDLEFYEPEDGPNAGESQLTGGSIVKLEYFDQDGNTMLTVEDFAMPANLVQAWANREDDGFDIGWDFWQWLGVTDNTYQGSSPQGLSAEEAYWENSDYIRTGSGDDLVIARGGSDFIVDGGGADIYKGGAGHDGVDYSQSYYSPWLGTAGISVDLAAGTATGSDGEVDQLVGIERIVGSAYDDTMYGDKYDNEFSGLLGDDFINGRGGFDIVDYSRADNQGGYGNIVARLGSGIVLDAFGSTDTLRNIEGIEGTDLRDRIYDNNGDNYLRGRDGNDTLRASGGDDYLRGGDGADKFIFKGNNFGENVISDFNQLDGDVIRIINMNSMDDLILEGGDEYAIIRFGSSSIDLYDMTANELTSDDFIF